VRIVFLGTPEFAVPIAEASARSGELVAVVAQPDRPVGRSSTPRPPATKRWAAERGIPVEQPDKVKQGRLAAILARYAPDVAVVAAYGRILPPDALSTPRMGCLNVHASLLPELRGAAPAQWAIARGYERTGVTIQQMDEGLDTGDLRLQRDIPIAQDETGESLLEKLATLGAEALEEALRLLDRGKLPRSPQDHLKATLAPLLTREDGRADFRLSARELDQRRRGFTPWPGAWTTVSGNVLKIHSAELRPAGPRREGQIEGEVLEASPHGIDVLCGGGSIWRLLEVQPEGKRRMSAAAYLAGHPLLEGERLGG
jgi:methionyl-tRNA formyltransferase